MKTLTFLQNWLNCINKMQTSGYARAPMCFMLFVIYFCMWGPFCYGANLALLVLQMNIKTKVKAIQK